jgi:hypothetical protein
MEAIMERQEIPNKEAAVETIGAREPIWGPASGHKALLAVEEMDQG